MLPKIIAFSLYYQIYNVLTRYEENNYFCMVIKIYTELNVFNVYNSRLTWPKCEKFKKPPLNNNRTNFPIATE